MDEQLKQAVADYLQSQVMMPRTEAEEMAEGLDIYLNERGWQILDTATRKLEADLNDFETDIKNT